MSKIRTHLIVSGMVQGVGFRYTTQMKAKEMGLTGWVRNLADGTVEIEVEGDDKVVYPFVDLMKKGPRRFIHVDHVDIETYDDLKGYTAFEIR
ncbi:Acylphosphatase [Paraliobacillus sp. PM-2]|uniref:acylphosphatase n=1 Tax=Paraliobacillus sp. PM-2 TaxID=1462524 RepID=UPI00061BA797|nr:acylphosphatase [Paraliobacillus sp. PM-2]CQR46632.1 Acylphosphatase [Paraliobacillus sp. PM-2]